MRLQGGQEHNDILEHYRNEGWKLVKADPETKAGVDHAWQLRDVSLAEVRRYLDSGGGVGVQVGEVSNWLAVCDADHEYAIATAPAFLPPTLVQAKGGEASHYFYYCEGLGYRQYNDLSGNRLIDIKASANGAGHLVVVAPTIHPRKGAYEYIGGFNPAAIAHTWCVALERDISLWACSALIAAELPKTREEGEGGRHDISKAIAGFGLRSGWSEEETLKVLLEAWKARRAPEKALRAVERNVTDTADKLRRDEPATGGRTLEELVPGLAGRIAKFMSWERADMRSHRRHYMRTDLGNAERFVDVYGDVVRWCPARKLWLLWDGRRWRWDEKGEVSKLAHKIARSIFHDAAHTEDRDEQKKIATFATLSQNTSRIKAMLTEAKPYLAIEMSELDTDPLLLNCQNGTLDLRTGQLRDPDPKGLITKIAPVDYDSDAKAPRFLQFLKEVLVDEAVISFAKRYCGYTLTGSTRERVFAILYGFGKNGKSTLVELLQDVLGDYATNTDTETILMKRYQGVGNDVAALKGARFVSASEVEKGRRLAESKVKQLTGSDTVTARFLFGEPFNFRPEFKLWLSTNNKPVIQGTDDAIWDRIRLIPFTQRFEGDRADPELPAKLREELPGVLAWMVEGCLEWQEQGLGEPDAVTAATKQYREEMDTLAAFIEEKCVVAAGARVAATPLYKEYREWCEEAGEKPGTQKAFGMQLSERGFESRQLTNGPYKGRKGWFGIGLKVDDPGPDNTTTPPEKPLSKSITPNKGLLGRPSGENRLLDEFRVDTPYTPGVREEVDDGRPKNQHLRSTQPREEKNVEKRSTSSTSSTVPLSADLKSGQTATLEELREQREEAKRQLTEDEAIEVQKLIAEGMSPAFARAEVLKEDAPY